MLQLVYVCIACLLIAGGEKYYTVGKWDVVLCVLTTNQWHKLIMFFDFTGITCSTAQVIPESQNVASGQTVEFASSIINPESTITWSTKPIGEEQLIIKI